MSDYRLSLKIKSPEEHRLMMHDKLVHLLKEEKDLFELKRILEDRINTKRIEQVKEEEPKAAYKVMEEESSVSYL